ncbi:hypothetical protein Agub_g13682 [Astrephomene gubernaculifera]|uniref:Uncharacterized protein n=1 Tax=Astrephomene gubernaculifera TaxID=47775 RepID=A0AAD3E1T2_9CHLO|nr:hypothetical protein Agub_g13682 [Astrephomene gubernaculifera]
MGALDDAKEALRYPLFRSASAHTHGAATPSRHAATAKSPAASSGLAQASPPEGSCGVPLVAWPEEGADAPSPRILQPRRRGNSVHVASSGNTAAAAVAAVPAGLGGGGGAAAPRAGWDALRSGSDGVLPRSSSARMLPSSRFGQEPVVAASAAATASGRGLGGLSATPLKQTGSTGNPGGSRRSAEAAGPGATASGAAAGAGDPASSWKLTSVFSQQLRTGPSRRHLHVTAPLSGGIGDSEEPPQSRGSGDAGRSTLGSSSPAAEPAAAVQLGRLGATRGATPPESPSSQRLAGGMAARVSGLSSRTLMRPGAVAAPAPAAAADSRPGTASSSGCSPLGTGCGSGPGAGTGNSRLASPAASSLGSGLGLGSGAAPRYGRRSELDSRGSAGGLLDGDRSSVVVGGGGGGGLTSGDADMGSRRRRREVQLPPSSSGGAVLDALQLLPRTSSGAGAGAGAGTSAGAQQDAQQSTAGVAAGRCPHQPHEQPPPQRLLRSRSSRLQSLRLVSEPSGGLGGGGGAAGIGGGGAAGIAGAGMDSDASTDVEQSAGSNIAGRGSMSMLPTTVEPRQPQPQQQQPRVPRHPPVVRVSIGLLPSTLQSPGASPATAAAAAAATAACASPRASGIIPRDGGLSPTASGSAAAVSPTAAAAAYDKRVLSPRSPSASPMSALTAAAGPAATAASASTITASAIHHNAAASSPSGSQSSNDNPPQPPTTSPAPSPPPPTPSLPGLPSFLGAPVVLEPHPPHVHAHAGGPGTPGPGLGPSLSRSTSNADRSHSNTSLGGLQAVPPSQPTSQPQAQPSDNSFGGGGGSSRTRLLRVSSSNSRRSCSSHSSFRRNGSYFWVREAVPEAVLENIPGLQAHRGLPQQPPHPGAVPEDGPPPPPPPLLQSLTGAAAAAAATTTPAASGLPSSASMRRRGMELAVAGLPPAAVGGSSFSQMGLVSSSGYSQTGSMSGNTSWLRRSEAMPPVDLLPIAPAPPPLALDHLHSAAAQQAAASLRGSNFSREGGDGGDDGAAVDGWRRGGDLQVGGGTHVVQEGPVIEELPSSASLAEVPSAAVMAAAAVASTLSPGEEGLPPSTSHDGSFAVTDSKVRNATSGGPTTSSFFDDGGGNGTPESASPLKSKLPSWPAPAPPLAQPRQTPRNQSKMRLLNFTSGFGFGGGGTVAASDSSTTSTAVGAAAAGGSNSEQVDMFALLGSNRMPSSVLTATAYPHNNLRVRSSSGSTPVDLAVHGVRDPNYDSVQCATIPEHAPSPALPSNSFLLGNSRMGSTVFSPPGGKPGGTLKKASSLRPQRAVGATRAAMPDLLALSRRVGSNTVVGPDGRTVHITVHGSSASDGQLQLELPPPEELVAAVNGHLPSSANPPLESATSTGSGGAGGSRLSIAGGGSRRTMGSRASPSSRGRPSPGAIHSLTALRFEGLMAPSSDGSEDRASSDVARRVRSFKTLAATSGTAPRNSSGGGGSSTGGGGVSHHSGVPSLIRHLSAPARRLQHSSSSGLTTGGGHPAAIRGGVGGVQGHPGHKSLISAGINFLKRAFSLRAHGREVASWHPEEAPRTRSLGGASGQPLWPGNELTPSRQGTGSGSGELVGNASLYYNPEGGAAVAAAGGSSASVLGPAARRLMASQKSFVKHSAVLGWVQQLGREEDGASTAPTATLDSDAEGDAMSAAAVAAAATAAANSAARLHSLQSLMAAGGTSLTCDAVVAFNDADGAVDGGTVARRRRAAGGPSRRRGGAHGTPSDDATSGDVAGTGTGTGSGSGVDASTSAPAVRTGSGGGGGITGGNSSSGTGAGGGGGGGWMTSEPSAAGESAVTVVRPSLLAAAGGGGGDDGPASTTSLSMVSTRPSVASRPTGTPPTTPAVATPPSPSAESLPGPKLLARLGSNLLGRSGRRSGLVVPVSGPYDGGGGGLDGGDLSYSLPSGSLGDVRMNSSGVVRL